ncbi:mid-like protein type b [Micromonas commoda]|uniref:Mid-like protein type b n=1 Tax=Micromonas commoda (strain RCC299 / NOUM17 / CCMP2709) TaxID=296587 RepID=C1FE17_MICCC|nr:mid-like protein type b [Micromonas commoda]ACO68884.1 mid-like protein type b [Micromonas commoda]|eukprot:XP_002507626.1 mid-like protein type b [Micromonas commoda]
MRATILGGVFESIRPARKLLDWSEEAPRSWRRQDETATEQSLHPFTYSCQCFWAKITRWVVEDSICICAYFFPSEYLVGRLNSRVYSLATLQVLEEPTLLASSENKPRGIDRITSYFHQSIDTAATNLNTCATMLKRICRLHGLHRWPGRKVSTSQVTVLDSE